RPDPPDSGSAVRADARAARSAESEPFQAHAQEAPARPLRVPATVRGSRGGARRAGPAARAPAAAEPPGGTRLIYYRRLLRNWQAGAKMYARVKSSCKRSTWN